MTNRLRKVDLTLVAPERREIVSGRIEAIERFRRNRSLAAAEREAAHLGIGRSLFYLLVKQWDQGLEPHELTGSGRPKRHQRNYTDAQMAILREVDDAMPNGRQHAVIEMIHALAAKRGIHMPTAESVRRKLLQLKAGRNPQTSGLIIDHCAVDIPAGTGDHPFAMPLLTMLYHSSGPTILGMALSHGEPTPAAAAYALLDGCERGHAIAPGTAIDFRVGEELAWNQLANIVTRYGLRHVGTELRERNVGRRMVAAFGPRPGGIWLRPYSSWRAAEKRPAKPRRNSVPMTLEDADAFVRGRLFAINERTPERSLVGSGENAVLVADLKHFLKL